MANFDFSSNEKPLSEFSLAGLADIIRYKTAIRVSDVVTQLQSRLATDRS